MSTKHQIYQCSVCNNVVEILRGGNDQLEACHKPTLIVEKTQDAGAEKHVPVVTKTAQAIHVAIGSIPHPMEETHFIEWIELLTTNRVYRVYLSPKDKPEAEFPLINGPFMVREFCNLHGLWKAEVV